MTHRLLSTIAGFNLSWRQSNIYGQVKICFFFIWKRSLIMYFILLFWFWTTQIFLHFGKRETLPYFWSLALFNAETLELCVLPNFRLIDGPSSIGNKNIISKTPPINVVKNQRLLREVPDHRPLKPLIGKFRTFPLNSSWNKTKTETKTMAVCKLSLVP